ncbi:hypothetical protein ACE7GA_04710 [Roseomonas sp. CCTCC AB2023176]|uniref:hypothetical protein n=1 Tax=Roseomonas sp. CCTCC AB2023176 TaxID=3342640 RepID=UPI0035E11CB0
MRRIALAIAVHLAAGTARAQDTAPPPDAGWRGQVTPYPWLIAVGGAIQPRDGLPTFDASLPLLGLTYPF